MAVAEGLYANLALCHQGWLQWGRNLTVAEGDGKLRRGNAHGRASMGPQLDSCGRVEDCLVGEGQAVLQWGRNLAVAEGEEAEGPDPQSAPLQWGRNLAVAEGGSARSCDSSCCAHFNGAA